MSKSVFSVAGILVLSAISSALVTAFGAEDLSIKGDRLGLSLVQFKQKYSRVVQGDFRMAPFCSDSSPGTALSTLLAEPWHAGAGIVTCSTHYPFEAHKGVVPTLAGQTTELFVHHFLDGQLFQVTIFFDHSGFADVRSAVQAKYGPPERQSTEVLQNRMGANFESESLTWNDGVAILSLTERVGNIDRSALILVDPLLEASVRAKAPGPHIDDI